MKTFTLSQLAEGVNRRSLGADSSRLLSKWSATGLLEGLQGTQKEGLARLLENQTAQLLNESNAISTGGAGLTSSGQIAGFSNVAFPIVRRVFAGLVTNEVVDNKLGKEINHQFRVDGKIDREMEADLVLPLDVAEDFYTWLGEKILQCKALQ
jgi:hypothetical protein